MTPNLKRRPKLYQTYINCDMVAAMCLDDLRLTFCFFRFIILVRRDLVSGQNSTRIFAKNKIFL